MAPKIIKDNGFDQAMLDLVKEVFERNKIKHDPTDYVAVKVSSAFKIPGLARDNSIMQLAPLTSNMRLPNLKLYYNREDIREVLEPFDPYLSNIDPNANAYEMIDEINKSIGNQLTLRKEDFYDTYVAQGDGKMFLDLHAKPDSYFYYGGYKIPVVDSELFRLTFDIYPEIERVPVGLRIRMRFE